MGLKQKWVGLGVGGSRKGAGLGKGWGLIGLGHEWAGLGKGWKQKWVGLGKG